MNEDRMTLTAAERQWLMSRFRTQVKFEEPMAKHTTFRVGGPAEALFEPESVEQLTAFVTWALEKGFTYRVIGGGSNLLVTDKGIRGVVVKLSKRMNRIREKERTQAFVRVTAMAGARLQTLCRYAIRNGFDGLNFAMGIPGTVGGAIMMNAGTANGAIDQVLDAIEILKQDGRIEKIDRGRLNLSYRALSLNGNGNAGVCGQPVILSGVFRLGYADPNDLNAEASAILKLRKKREPTRFPNAGCFFKNPSSETPAGRLIDQAGLKGKRVGDAQVSEKHANYLINRKHATADDILNLSRQVQSVVREKFNIDLEPEVKIFGET
jgi:UDP-N-acetylmuramate dehydrogenase